VKFVFRRVIPIVLSVSVLATVFLPWADAGVALGVESVFGHEIPVVGWSTIVASFVLIGFSLMGALHLSRWWWVGASFVAVVMLTSAGITLMAIDVVDSVAVRWIVEVLPQSVQDASPSISASYGLWVMIGLLLLYAISAAVVTVRLGAALRQKSS